MRLILYMCLWTPTGYHLKKKKIKVACYSWNPIANAHWVCTERCARACLWTVLSLWTHYTKYHLYIYSLVKVNTFRNNVHNFRWLCTYSLSKQLVFCDNLDLQTLCLTLPACANTMHVTLWIITAGSNDRQSEMSFSCSFVLLTF